MYELNSGQTGRDTTSNGLEIDGESATSGDLIEYFGGELDGVRVCHTIISNILSFHRVLDST
jgi:hypothetical protein